MNVDFEISRADCVLFCRTNAFEVMGIDGNSSGILQFEDSLSLAEWIAAITNNITQLLNQMVSHF